MSIVFVPVARTTRDVEIKMLREDGKYSKGTLAVTYKLLGQHEYREVLPKMRDGAITDADWFAEYVLDVKGIKDGDNKPVEFDADLAKALADCQDTCWPILNQWTELQNRRGVEAEKN